MIIRAPIPMIVQPIGVLKSHYLGLPTGIAVEVQGQVTMKNPLQFAVVIGRICNDQDLAKEDSRVKVPVHFKN